MSVPTLTGLTSIDPADSTTNWSGWGQNSAKWGTSSEIKKEGSNSIALQPFQTGDGGYGYQTAATIDLGSNLVMIWVYTASPSFVNTFASTPAGVYIRVTDSTSSWTTTYNDYYVGGSDIAWVGRGWHLVVLDCNRTRDRGSGTVTLANVRRVGVGFNIAATASKSDVVAIDAMYYGTTLEATGPSFTDGTNGIDINSGGTIDRNDGGSFVTDGWETGDYIKIVGSATSSNDGVYEITGVAASQLTTAESFTQDTANTTMSIYCSVTLEDIYQKDGPTDDNWKGVVDKDPGGAYIINYPLTIGDVSGALDCFFLSRNENIVLADQPVDTTLEDFLVGAEDTGETYIQFGDSSGTGDSRVGFGGSTVTGQGTIFSTKTPIGADLSAEVSGLEVYGTSFIGLDGGIQFATTGTSHYVTTTTFSGCGQVDLGGVEARNLTFTGFTGAASTGALLWNDSIDFKNSNFLANDRAIEHPTSGVYSYQGLSFAGNTYDIDFSDTTATDSYDPTNQDSDYDLYSGSTIAAGQGFTGDGNDVDTCAFYVRKVGSPTGTVVAKLYAHTGTFGTSGTPTGSALATSETVDVSGIGTSFEELTFKFATPYTTVNSTKYFIVIEYSGGDASNRIEVGYDGSTPGHGGNAATYVSSWTSQSTDLCFYVNGSLWVDATDSDPSTSVVTGSLADPVKIANAVNLKVTVKTADGTAVQNAQTAIVDSNGNTLMNEDTLATGIAEESYNYGGSPVDVEIRVRKASTTDNPKYRAVSQAAQITANGLDALVTLEPV